MAIETRLSSRQNFWHMLYIVGFTAFGLWGWYDYAITIPNMERAVAEYEAAEKTKGDLEKQSATAALDEAQKAAFKAAESTLAKYKEKPVPPAAYDRAVQLWLYMVGCGGSVPFVVYMNIMARRRRYRLDDDGTLTTPEGVFRHDEIVGLDLSKWMEKWIAKVKVADGREIKLDDYQYQFTEDIVGVLAARFEPGKWTSDARPIGDPKSRDTKKALAEQEAREAAEAESSGQDSGSESN